MAGLRLLQMATADTDFSHPYFDGRQSCSKISFESYSMATLDRVVNSNRALITGIIKIVE